MYTFITHDASMNRFETFYERYMIAIGSVGHLLFVLQTIKIIRMGSAHDISLSGFIISLLSLLSWLFYGFLKKDKPLILVNAFGACAAFICILTIILFK